MITKTFIISGMHCTSCALNIDGELEDTNGVKESSTNYASQKTTVIYDEKKLTEDEVISVIHTLGYQAKLQ